MLAQPIVSERKSVIREIEVFFCIFDYHVMVIGCFKDTSILPFVGRVILFFVANIFFLLFVVFANELNMEKLNWWWRGDNFLYGNLLKFLMMKKCFKKERKATWKYPKIVSLLQPEFIPKDKNTKIPWTSNIEISIRNYATGTTCISSYE